MQKYALIENGMVMEIIAIPAGEPTLSERYHAAIVEKCIELTGNNIFTVAAGWRHDGSGFYKAPDPVPAAIERYVVVATVRERLEAIGKWADLVAILQNDPALMMKVLTLRDGISPNDPQARQMIEYVGANPDEILAP